MSAICRAGAVTVLVPLAHGQMEYARQAVLHLRQDRDSEVQAMLNTTTQFVAGGVALVSAVWNQDIGGVLTALSGLKATTFDYLANQPKPW